MWNMHANLEVVMISVQMQYLLKILPAELGSQVAKNLNEKLFSKILLFERIHDPLDRAEFAAAVLPLPLSLNHAMFSGG